MCGWRLTVNWCHNFWHIEDSPNPTNIEASYSDNVAALWVHTQQVVDKKGASVVVLGIQVDDIHRSIILSVVDLEF